MYTSSDENKVVISGVLESPFKLNHYAGEMPVLSAKIRSERSSGKCDNAVLKISGEKLEKYPEEIFSGKICIYGTLSSCKQNPKATLDIKVTSFGTVEDENGDKNEVTVSGRIYEVEKIRSTLEGIPVRSFVLVSTNYDGVESYIPVVVWADYAKNMNESDVGLKVEVTGRFESRLRTKFFGADKKVVINYAIAAQTVKFA